MPPERKGEGSMSPRIRNLRWRQLIPVGVAAALLIPVAPAATAAPPDRGTEGAFPQRDLRDPGTVIAFI
jgi:hypothetical protein